VTVSPQVVAGCERARKLVEEMVGALESPDDGLPPMLLLAGGDSGTRMIELDGDELNDQAGLYRLLTESLPEAVAQEGYPKLFALILPVWAKPHGEPVPASGDFSDHPLANEQISLYVGDHQGYTVTFADVHRYDNRPPLLSSWIGGPGTLWSAEYVVADALCHMIATLHVLASVGEGGRS
jgi:hypothetical protein